MYSAVVITTPHHRTVPKVKVCESKAEADKWVKDWVGAHLPSLDKIEYYNNYALAYYEDMVEYEINVVETE